MWIVVDVVVTYLPVHNFYLQTLFVFNRCVGFCVDRNAKYGPISRKIDPKLWSWQIRIIPNNFSTKVLCLMQRNHIDKNYNPIKFLYSLANSLHSGSIIIRSITILLSKNMVFLLWSGEHTPLKVKVRPLMIHNYRKPSEIENISCDFIQPFWGRVQSEMIGNKKPLQGKNLTYEANVPVASIHMVRESTNSTSNNVMYSVSCNSVMDRYAI